MRTLIDRAARAVNSTILSAFEAVTVAVVRDDRRRKEVYAVLSGVRTYADKHPYLSWNPLFPLNQAAVAELTQDIEHEMTVLVEVSRLQFDEERMAAAREAILKALQGRTYKRVEVPDFFGQAS